MTILKAKPNAIDALIGILVVALVVLALVALTNKPKVSARTVRTTMISNRYSEERADQVLDQAKKQINKNVYFDSTLATVKLASVEKEKRADGTSVIVIALESTGEVTQERAVFNGLRVYVGQKAEVHSVFVIKGLISKIEYAN